MMQLRSGLIFSVLIAMLLPGCVVAPKPEKTVVEKPLVPEPFPETIGLSTYLEAPEQCFAPEKQLGAPAVFYRESIFDQPVLIERRAVEVPSLPIAGRNFYCAAFQYSVDEAGHVKDVITLYNSHPGINGIDFAMTAKQQLQHWRYKPGMVDKAAAIYTGLTTVFYYGFEG